MSDLSKAKVVVVVFAMKGCGACDEYAPRFERQIEHFKKHGVPFVWGDKFSPGQIPVLLIDVASADESAQIFADKFQVSGTPTTAILTKRHTAKAEGAIPDAELHGLLNHAVQMNR